jgi:serine/threonine protein kinase
MRPVNCLIGFEYRGEEILSLSDGRRYPVVLMDWVEGQTLFQWLRSRCRAGSVAPLASAAQQWHSLIGELTAAQVAHGDLQHANILVTPSERFKLVDYDGMCVPALVGQRNLEVGTPPYQHPHRSADTPLALHLDNFSALELYVVLRALAAAPTLWTKYVEKWDYDKLLFRADDFRAPDRSSLRRDLFNSPDRQVRDLTACLFASARDAIDRVPHLNDLVTQESCVSKSIHPVTVTITTLTEAPPAYRPTNEEAEGPHGARSRQPPNLWAGNIDGYEIGDLLGKGIRGAVYKAVSKTDRRSVAIKIVPMRGPASQNERSRFLRNMNRDGHLQHPNIIAQFKSGAVGSSFYFVMEYCGGGNLSQWMGRQGGKLRLDDVRPMMQQCLDALKCAHLHHVVHGDLKPHNILFDASAGAPLVKISDFALARNFETMRFSGRTATDSHPLDVRFTPRERLTSDHYCRPISDLWSLAAVFYHTITGWFPLDFRGRNAVEVILTEEPVPLHQRDDSIPIAVANVIDRALRTEPAHRYQTAAEMKAALDEAFTSVMSPSNDG